MAENYSVNVGHQGNCQGIGRSQCMDNKLFGVIAVLAILKRGNGDLGYWFNIRRLFISDNHYKLQLTFCSADLR